MGLQRGVRGEVDSFGVAQESIPQGLKPPSLRGIERPKAEALGYLEAKASAAPTATAEAKATAKAIAATTATAEATAKTRTGDKSNDKDKGSKGEIVRLRCSRSAVSNFAQDDEGFGRD
jgi:hypothetical protein